MGTLNGPAIPFGGSALGDRVRRFAGQSPSARGGPASEAGRCLLVHGLCHGRRPAGGNERANDHVAGHIALAHLPEFVTHSDISSGLGGLPIDHHPAAPHFIGRQRSSLEEPGGP
jgi:hypothetical protein